MLESPNGTIGAEGSLIPAYAEPRQATNRGNKLRAAEQLGISEATLGRILGNDPHLLVDKVIAAVRPVALHSSE